MRFAKKSTGSRATVAATRLLSRDRVRPRAALALFVSARFGAISGAAPRSPLAGAIPMKKTNRKKLSLDRTTIANLTNADFSNVHGGMPPETRSACADQTCTQFCPTRLGCVTKTADCL
jgi:hypothetical protein